MLVWSTNPIKSWRQRLTDLFENGSVCDTIDLSFQLGQDFRTEAGEGSTLRQLAFLIPKRGGRTATGTCASRVRPNALTRVLYPGGAASVRCVCTWWGVWLRYALTCCVAVRGGRVRRHVYARAPTLAPHSAIAVLSHVPAALWYTLRALLGVLIRSGRGGPANHPILCTGLL